MCVLIIIGAGLLSYKITNSYALFSDSIKGEKTIELSVLIEKEWNYSYTGDVQTFEVPMDGYYYIELGGASGGISNPYGALGAKTSGYINLSKDEKLYFYIGKAGTTPNTNCRTSGYEFNGGGIAMPSSEGLCGPTGGGATDVRLVGGSWDNMSSLISRIMVAGAGGGVSYLGQYSRGNGGTLYGAQPIFSTYQANLGKPGTQIAGGAEPTKYSTAQSTGTAGSFGKGGYGGANKSGSTSGGGSGGGAGYYGGSGASGLGQGIWPGGGGSSYISGYAGVNSVEESTTITHTNQTLHYSGKYFIGGQMIEGQNKGDGYAKIKYVGAKPEKKTTKLNNVRYIKDCSSYNSDINQNHWNEIQAIKDGVNIAKGKTVTGTYPEANSTTYSYKNIVDGTIDSEIHSGFGYGSNNSVNQCVTVDLGSSYELDEVAVWQAASENGRSYYDSITYVSSDNSTWTTVIDEAGTETSNGKRINAYTDTLNGYIQDNLVLWYDGYANTGRARNHTTTTWKDLSGNNNDGTLNGSTWYSDFIYFDGVDDYVQSNSSLDISGDANLTMCTVATWAGSTWSTNYPSYMGIASTTTNSSLAMTLQNGKPALDFLNNRYQASNALELGKKYQICMTKTSGAINDTSKIYINGKEVIGTGNSALSPNITKANAIVGRLDSTRWSNAKIYSAMFYNKALNAEEVFHNYLYDQQKFNIK